ncbi:MAG: hypothetical protein V3U84_04620 [Thiotrichaceae bacterium]
MSTDGGNLSTNWRCVGGFIVVAALVMRGVWMWKPGISTCALFWLCAIFVQTLLIIDRRYLASKVAQGFVVLGAISNMIVTLTNGGYMPVVSGDNHSFWVTATDTHKLMPLADIYSGFSIGDFAIGLGLVLAFVFWIGRNYKLCGRSQMIKEEARGNEFYNCKFVGTQDGFCIDDEAANIRIVHCKVSLGQTEGISMEG